MELLARHDASLMSRGWPESGSTWGNRLLLAGCMYNCARDPIAIFRLLGRGGSESPGRYLPLAIELEREETAKWLASEHTTAADLWQVLMVGAIHGEPHEGVRLLAEDCRRLIATEGRIITSECAAMPARELLISESRTEDVWKWLDDMHRLLGLTEPIVVARGIYGAPSAIDYHTCTEKWKEPPRLYELHQDIDQVLGHPATLALAEEKVSTGYALPSAPLRLRLVAE